jgi:hypothetical protein|tara:strand:- start:246 stop:425 length:180 start_codon:yes stop_codon:yes gene_type:complete
MLEIIATVADDNANATKVPEGINARNTFRESVTEHCGGQGDKFYGMSNEYHLRAIRQKS